ncbi:MAG: hypothetical protein AB8F94_20975 [Saprospiraceae bacterium]
MTKIRFIISVSLFAQALFFSQIGFSQNQNPISSDHNKGDFYVYWGWNRGWFSDSDIHFRGNNYDFNLENVVATDRQSSFNLKTYFHPTYVTIPQYNFRVGYFFHEKYNISIASDHMKYVVQNDQTVNISGEIEDSETVYDGIYNKDKIVLAGDFLRLEHTDGLNYINVAMRRSDRILKWRMLEFHLTEGIGTGILFPRTNATLLNKKRNDQFHLSGYGFDAMVGLRTKFFKYFFVQTESKIGWINMPDIRTTDSTDDKASQQFFFGQWNVVFGARFKLKKKK